jgi:hypothetical protein
LVRNRLILKLDLMYLLLIFFVSDWFLFSWVIRQIFRVFGLRLLQLVVYLYLFNFSFRFMRVSLVGCFVYIKLGTWISSEVMHVDWGLCSIA